MLLYGVMPGDTRLSGQIPPSLQPGAVIHFSAVASGADQASGAACASDLRRLDFDLTVR